MIKESTIHIYFVIFFHFIVISRSCVVANNLVLQAQNGNTSAAIFYLKTQAGWKETERHEIVGDEEQPFVWKIQVMNNTKVIENNQ